MTDALFIDPRGPYPALLGAEHCWDEKRDARTYAGPGPVVCHPPCQLWTNMAAVNFKRWGGEHNRPGNDGGCFAFALETVLRCCGVLEHPAGSKAFAAHGLPMPRRGFWQRHELRGFVIWVCEVSQCAYGHRARKRTWLVYAGWRVPFDLDWAEPEATHQIGWFDRKKPTLGKREASATPPSFARELARLAAWSAR